ncbi:cyclin-J [Anopheles marshallii]|uniref:cyclin-J n=1 Tax=Anopheles marshallii TaxID=1521116 RepID=UPI00237A50F9|nr:cyclin-J [Anopheles marshallii]
MDRWNIFSNGVYCNEYEQDILETLKECERYRRTVYFVSPQLKYRTATVRLIEKVCEQQSYRRDTLHLAIYLLDVFMCNHAIPNCRLGLVALTCLYVACKIEENEPNVPTILKLNRILANAYTPADFTAMEVTILTFFDWHITIPTASTFLDIFLQNSFNQEDYNDMPKNLETEQTSVERIAQAIQDASDMFLKNSLQQLKLCNIKPSLLAAGCVAAGRFNIKNMPVWNDRLVRITGYDYDDIHSICKLLLFASFPQSTALIGTPYPDAGYLSECHETDEDNSSYSSGQSSNITSEDIDNTTITNICSEATIDKGVIGSANDTGEPSAKKRKIVVVDWSSQ